jgi:hypothetical protein
MSYVEEENIIEQTKKIQRQNQSRYQEKEDKGAGTDSRVWFFPGSVS